MKGGDIFQMSTELIESIIEGMGDGISIQDTNFKVLFQNGAHKGFVGEHIGEYCYKAYEKRENVCDGCPVAMSFKDDKVHTAERVVPINGELKCFEITSSLLKGRNGDVIGAIENIRDVTERNKADEKLRRFEHIVSTSKDMMALLDKNYVYLAINNAYRNGFGRVSEDIVGHSVSDVFGQEFFNKAIKPHAELCLAGEEVSYHDWFEFSVYGKRYMEVIYTPYIGQDKEVKGFIVNGRDITDKKKAVDALRQSENRFREMFNNMSNGVVIYSAIENGENFIIKDINAAGEKMTMLKKEDVMEKKVTEIFPEVKEFGLFEKLQQVWKTGEPQHQPVTMYKDERLSSWFENYICKLPKGDIVAIFDDVTAQRQAEEALKNHADKLERLNKAFVGRELKMKELKKENEELKKGTNLPAGRQAGA